MVTDTVAIKRINPIIISRFLFTNNSISCYDKNIEMKLISFLFTALIFLTIADISQAKVLPQAKKGVTASKTSTSGIYVTPKLRGDRRALNVYFSNLQNAAQVSYSLVYDTNSQQEGAMGAINLTGSSNTTQELLFGTCSKNVCRYHSGIKNAKLEISYTLKNGKKYLKKYRIKV